MRFDDVEALLENMERPEPSAALLSRIQADAEVVQRERTLPRKDAPGLMGALKERARGLFGTGGFMLPGLSGGVAAAAVALVLFGFQSNEGFGDMDAIDVAYVEGYLLDWPLDGEETAEEVALFAPIWE